jgi:hypothetical protein
VGSSIASSLVRSIAVTGDSFSSLRLGVFYLNLACCDIRALVWGLHFRKLGRVSSASDCGACTEEFVRVSGGNRMRVGFVQLLELCALSCDWIHCYKKIRVVKLMVRYAEE